ncbi:histidine kinase [Raineyella fluvialis]|uniref:histidine kinase n=1 Tax=Raineyella fluvialis TaxID=2662261 RepID=UPI00188FC677|nr:histidine kinase [Raineyella fluvialis]
MQKPSEVPPTLVTVRRVAWTVLGGSLAVLVCLVALVGSLSVVPAYQSHVGLGGQLTSVGVLALLAWLVAMATLFARRAHPWVPMVAGVLLTVVLQLDSLLLLFGAASVVVHRGRRQGAIASTVAGALTLVAGLRDGLRPWRDSAWAAALSSSSPLSATPDPQLQLGVSLGIAFVSGVVVLGSAWLVRSRQDLGETEEARAQAEDRSERLATATVRLEERERLAREVHDTLAHRLSLISLNSGALETAALDGSPRWRKQPRPCGRVLIARWRICVNWSAHCDSRRLPIALRWQATRTSLLGWGSPPCPS